LQFVLFLLHGNIYINSPFQQHGNNFYRTDRSLETVRHVKTARVLFMWMTATTIMTHFIHGAAYAVPFFIPARPPFQVLDLSYVLLHFMDKHIRDSNYTRFKLISFSFKMDSEGTYGLLLFDEKLRRAFKKAQRRADNRPAKYRSEEFLLPLSTWPSDCAELRESTVIFKLKQNAE
jgi:hypothetical protein